MADTAGTINYDSRTATTTLSVGSITLNYDDTLTLSIGSGFPNPSNTQITLVEFWNDANHGKGSTLMGSWNSGGTGIVPEGVSVAAQGSGIRISDDDLTNDVNYYYNVVATDSGTNATYPADPELIIRKKTIPPSGRARTPEVTP